MKSNKSSKKVFKGGVVYVGRIPHGFYEEEMKKYFEQFGKIKRLRLSRNPKTGSSRHYAFIQFESNDVAKVVAETMDNYLLYNRLLQCKYMDHEKIHPDTFKNADKPFTKLPTVEINKALKNRRRIGEEWTVACNKMIKNDEKRQAKIQNVLKSSGIDFEFPKNSILNQKAMKK